MAETLNAIAKLVVSITLDTVEWNNSTLIRGDVVDELRRIKQLPGKNISLTGSPTLTRSLLAAGLIDVLSLLVHPIVLGSGQRLFTKEIHQREYTLTHSATHGNGVVHLCYQPK